LSYRRLFGSVVACLSLCTCLEASPSTLRSERVTPNASSMVVNSSPSPATCGVTALPLIADDAALAFEKDTSPDIGNLKPMMARALGRFQQLVSLVGGTFELQSAYRPPSYQVHLQAVWLKWMLELRNNREPGCQALRAQVGEEFTRHRLLEMQKPVTSSDHTRGLAFDAMVVVPRAAWLNKRRVSTDRLALLAGIQRPDVLRDPVHFKLAIGRTIRSAGSRKRRFAARDPKIADRNLDITNCDVLDCRSERPRVA
jgi:hypothetical protein